MSLTPLSRTTCSVAFPPWPRRVEVLGFEARTSLDTMLDEVIPWVERALMVGTI